MDISRHFRMGQNRSLRRLVLFLLLFAPSSHNAYCNAQESEVETSLVALLDAASGRNQKFQLRAVLQVPMDGRLQDFLVDVHRDGKEFDVSLVNPEYMMTIRRRATGTALALPRHKVVFIGMGEAPTDDHLAFEGLALRMISSNSEMGRVAPLMLTLEPRAVLKMAQSAMGAKIEDSGTSFKASGMQFRVTKPGQLAASLSGMKMRTGVAQLHQPLPPLNDWPEYHVEEVDRGELERTLVRGLRRAIEVVLPGDAFKSPYAEEREVDNGRLTWIEGQRVVILQGDAEQIGRAHGELIGFEVNLCIDSILHTHTLMHAMLTGKWLRKELVEVASQLRPHIPQSYLDENRALAEAVGQSPEVIDALNVFPEMFRCSGFAVSNSASSDGKPLVGRILDRPAPIGLHDCATIFVVSPKGKTPFVHVSYAGFTGCITGMNHAQIAASQTGFNGRATGQGVPATSMVRMALEQCSSIEGITELWKSIPRNGAYDFTLADGKSGLALAVSTTASVLELIRSGGDHVKFGSGIDDAVVVSQGERLAQLQARIREAHGKLTAESAVALMASPVSNELTLSNVLLVPSEGTLHLSNANHQSAATQGSYAKLEFRSLLPSP